VATSVFWKGKLKGAPPREASGMLGDIRWGGGKFGRFKHSSLSFQKCIIQFKKGLQTWPHIELQRFN